MELGRQLAGGGGTCANSLFSMLLPGESASCASTASPRVSFVLFRAPRGSAASLPNRKKTMKVLTATKTSVLIHLFVFMNNKYAFQ